MKEILFYNHINECMIFDVDLIAIKIKSELMTELEKHLKKGDDDDCLKTIMIKNNGRPTLCQKYPTKEPDNFNIWFQRSILMCDIATNTI